MTEAGGKVFVAMSGGVDSSVAALLLQRAGYGVVGVTFKLFGNEDVEEEPERACCSLESVESARAVCDRLGVTHYTMSFVSEFGEWVIDRFICEYAAGRTPNPCVLCNRHIKFDAFLRKAVAIGAEYVATGHHARIERIEALYHLLPAADADKDQSYALAHLNQTTMPRVLLPVGDYTKTQVRDLAREAGLPTAETPESQDLCFVRRGTYRDFLTSRQVRSEPGPIVDEQGNTLGQHLGLEQYTVGQRKNLGISVGERLFVMEKRMADNALVVGPYERVCRREVLVEDVNWCDLPAGQRPEQVAGLRARAMLRYRQEPVPCTLQADGHTLKVVLERPAVAAPGQLLALYDPDDGHVLAGGTIV